MIAPVVLIVFAVLTATLGPRVLIRSSWPTRSPRLGIALWQALSVSVLSAVVLAGAAVAFSAVPWNADLAELLSACVTVLKAQYATPGGAALSATGALLVLLLVARTSFCVGAAMVGLRRTRRRQLESLTLVARRHHVGGVLVVEHDEPAAYCFPGRGGKVVLTTGALAALDQEQLHAVLAHERAHLRGRHDLVMAAAAGLLRAFPRVALFRVALEELGRLVEMLADDAAARRNPRLTIATAVVRLAEASAPAAALGAGGSTALARVRRLVAPAQPLGALRALLGGVAIGALLLTPAAVVTAPAFAAATSELCPIEFTA